MPEADKKTILIVEDDSVELKILQDRFGAEGFAVFVARDGAEGLETAISRHPDIILLDVEMPKMDGITMLKNLRQDSWGKEVKVIVLTGYGDAENVIKALEYGAEDYLVKTDQRLDDIVAKVRLRLGLD